MSNNCRPSNLFRRELCPASATEEARYGDITSANAERGTLLHAAVKTMFEGGLEIEDFNLSSSDFEQCQKAADMLRESVNNINDYILFWEKPIAENIYFTDGTGAIDLFGITEDKTAGLIVDFKFGADYISAYDNRQLQSYALVCFEEFPSLEEIHTIIIQPILDNTSMIAYTYEDRAILEDTISKIIFNTKDNPYYKAGLQQCKYCRAKGICPETKEIMQAVQFLETNDKSFIQFFEELTIAERGDIYKQLLVAESLVKSFKEQAESLILQGFIAGGYKLAPGRKSRFWGDLVQVEEAFSLADIELYQTKKEPLSVAQAEKIIGKKNFEFFKHLVAEKEGNLRIVEDKSLSI